MELNPNDKAVATGNKEAITYPYVKEQYVTLRPRINKPLLPENGTIANAAEDYTQVLGGSFAGFGSSRPLGRTIFDRTRENQLMPELIGVSPLHAEWDKLLDEYWGNFYFPVPIQGVQLNVSVRYDNDADAGTPISIRDYVVYQYALKHSWVANSVNDVNKSPKIKFYMWTQGEDTLRTKELLAIKDRATLKRMELTKDLVAAKNVLLVLNLPVPTTNDDLVLALVDVSEREPTRFLAAASDKALTEKAFIESLIRNGIMYRPLNSTVIMYDGVAVGNTTAEAVAWLNKVENATTKEVLRSQLKKV